MAAGAVWLWSGILLAPKMPLAKPILGEAREVKPALRCTHDITPKIDYFSLSVIIVSGKSKLP